MGSNGQVKANQSALSGTTAMWYTNPLVSVVVAPYAELKVQALKVRAKFTTQLSERGP